VLPIIAALLLAGGLLWLLRVPSRSAPDRDARDRDVLDEAEAEVRNLDAMASPEEADDALPDWGPGTPDR
jgi:hypothetical protein